VHAFGDHNRLFTAEVLLPQRVFLDQHQFG
jgi:hypothetical protein